MKAATALTLGRVSNLPTVWSNVLAGTVLAGGQLEANVTALVLAAVSCLYVAGMYLNDVCDVGWDCRHRPERPIPSGAATRAEVALWGAALMMAGPLLLLAAGGSAALGGVGLAAAILLYDVVHKHFAPAPWIMGACRALVYGATGLAAGGLTPGLFAGAAALTAYVAGLTHAARTEHLSVPTAWGPLLLLAAPVALALTRVPDQPAALVFIAAALAWGVVCLRRLRAGPQRNVGAAVGGLIAGIALVDAALLAAWGAYGPAAFAVAAFGATLVLHRRIAGT